MKLKYKNPKLEDGKVVKSYGGSKVKNGDVVDTSEWVGDQEFLIKKALKSGNFTEAK